MKKTDAFGISSYISLAIGFAGIFHILRKTIPDSFSELYLPAGFPSRTGLLVIWGFLFVLWGIGCGFVYSVKLNPRRKRNIFLNSLILIIGIFLWHFMVFSAVNLSGALAVVIALIILAVVVWAMYLVIHRIGGYLFIPTLVWLLYMLYLSIALQAGN